MIKVPAIAAVCACLATAGCNQSKLVTGVNATINSSNIISVASRAYYGSMWPLPLGDLGNAVFTSRAAIVNPAGAVVTYPCTVGAGSITWTDADGDSQFSTGDGFTFNFNGCTVRGPLGDVSYTGQLILSQVFMSGQPVLNPLAGWDFRALFKPVQLVAVQGGFSRSFSGEFQFESHSFDGTLETITASGLSLTAVGAAGTDTFVNFALSEQIDRSSFVYSQLQTAGSLNSAAYGSLNVATLSPFTGNVSFDPLTGVMAITAADKSYLRMTSNSLVDVTLELDSNGDGQFDDSQNVAWSVIAGQGRF